MILYGTALILMLLNWYRGWQNGNFPPLSLEYILVKSYATYLSSKLNEKSQTVHPILIIFVKSLNHRIPQVGRDP